MKLTSRIREFVSEHAPMFRRRSSTKQATSYVDRIPHELLLYIFQTIVNNDPHKITTLVCVCSRWRQIALSSGSLWSRVILTYPTHARHFPAISSRLVRSGSYPLDILCDFRDPSWNWEEDSHAFRWQEMELIMRLLLVHVGRWRRFELLTDTWAPVFTFLWYTRRVEEAPMLETLSLSRCNLYFAARGRAFAPVSLRQPIPLFGGTFLNSLTSMSLIGVHIDWRQPSLRNLTELTLKFQASDVMPSLPQFDAVFQACPGLLRFTIFGWGPIFDHSTPPLTGQLHLPHLLYFSFGFLDIPYSLQLLPLFDFPSLEEVVLEDISRAVSPTELQDDAELVHWLSSRNSRGSLRIPNFFPVHQLQDVKIHNINCDSATIASFLSEAASLQKLGLFDVSDEFLTLLIPQKEAVPLCPRLQELYCQDMDPAIVTEVCSSRASVDGCSLLNRVTVDFVRGNRLSSNSPIYRKLKELGIYILGKSESDSSVSDTSAQ